MLTPLTKLYIQRFKNNRRGYVSLIIFSIVFTLSIFSEFIANNKPLLVSYNNHLYLPILHNYAETTFGGTFETETNYKDPFVKKLINQHGFLLMPLIEYSHQFSTGNEILSPPSTKHLLGTDDQGRDIAAFIIYGFRLSVTFGFLLTISSSIIGIIIGALEGYFGGWFDIIMQRFLEIWESFPLIFTLIIISSVIQPNFFSIFFIMLAFSWMGLVNYVRAEFLRIRNFDYVKAARALGLREFTIIRHILPNALVSSFTFIPFLLTGSITILTMLDYLNFGLPKTYPSLGELTLEGKNNLDAPWIGITAFCTLSFMLTLLIFIGEAFRDAFDPRKVAK